MTPNPTPDRTPYCHKIRYGITGAPILDGDDMDGSHAPGVGLAPKLIELVYSPARDGKPARVDASVTGDWTRFGEPDDFGGQVTTHFKDGPDGWPGWLAEEARLHDPAVPCVSAVDQTTRDRIAEAPADRAAVLADAEGAIRTVAGNCGYKADDGCDFCNGVDAALEQLRRMADEAQQQEGACPQCGDAGACSGGPCPLLPAVGARQPDTQTPVVADDSEHVDGCPGCTAFTLTGHITAAVPGRSAATSTGEEAQS